VSAAFECGPGLGERALTWAFPVERVTGIESALPAPLPATSHPGSAPPAQSSPAWRKWDTRSAAVTYWPRFFDRNQAITALTVTDLLETGYRSDDPVVTALREELR
jgi:hypothetical protein